MMACGRMVGNKSWSGEAKAYILKRKHITYLIQFLAYIRQISKHVLEHVQECVQNANAVLGYF